MNEKENEFSRIFKDTKGSVLGAIAKNLKPDYAHMIDDVVQETYIRAYNSLKKNQFRYEASLNTWLYTIAKNESLRLNAKLNKQKNIEKTLDESFLINKSLQDNNSSLYHENFGHLDKLEAVQKIISKLPLKYKSVLELDILGFKDWQIADKLKISLGTVKSRNSRAREKIRQWVHQMRLTG